MHLKDGNPNGNRCRTHAMVAARNEGMKLAIWAAHPAHVGGKWQVVERLRGVCSLPRCHAVRTFLAARLRRFVWLFQPCHGTAKA
jgi:hypothetical protein